MSKEMPKPTDPYIPRYTLIGKVSCVLNGEFVLARDYDVLHAEVEKLKAERDLLDDEGSLETIGKIRDLIFKDYPESQSEMISFPSEVLKCALDQLQKLKAERGELQRGWDHTGSD
jgi:hypothetical protein